MRNVQNLDYNEDVFQIVVMISDRNFHILVVLDKKTFVVLNASNIFFDN